MRRIFNFSLIYWTINDRLVNFLEENRQVKAYMARDPLLTVVCVHLNTISSTTLSTPTGETIFRILWQNFAQDISTCARNCNQLSVRRRHLGDNQAAITRNIHVGNVHVQHRNDTVK
jgi:hypothetical protein